MDAQLRYWDTFTTLKRDAIYINRYQGRVEYTDRCINIFFAVTSSAAIGGWAIWKEYSFLWGLLIATSQALSTSSQFRGASLPGNAKLLTLANQDANDYRRGFDTKDD